MKKIILCILLAICFLGGCTQIKYEKEGVSVSYCTLLTQKKFEDLHIQKTNDDITVSLGKAEAGSTDKIDAIVDAFFRRLSLEPDDRE